MGQAHDCFSSSRCTAVRQRHDHIVCMSLYSLTQSAPLPLYFHMHSDTGAFILAEVATVCTCVFCCLPASGISNGYMASSVVYCLRLQHRRGHCCQFCVSISIQAETGHRVQLIMHCLLLTCLQASAQPFLVFGLLTTGLAVGAANAVGAM